MTTATSRLRSRSRPSAWSSTTSPRPATWSTAARSTRAARPRPASRACLIPRRPTRPACTTCSAAAAPTCRPRPTPTARRPTRSTARSTTARATTPSPAGSSTRTGAFDDDTSVHVNNVAPTTSALTGDATVNESGVTEHSYSYTLFDPGTDTVTAHPSCGTGGTLVVGSDSNTNTAGLFKCKFLDGPASPTVSVYATDDDAPGNNNPGNTRNIYVTVNNVKPTPTITSLTGNSGPACLSGNTVTLGFSGQTRPAQTTRTDMTSTGATGTTPPSSRSRVSSRR